MQFLKHNYKKLIIGLIILAIVFFGYRQFNKGKKANANIFNPKKDTIVNPQRQNIKDQITLSGSIDAESKANLQFQTPGQLAWLGVKEGDKVKKYQAVAGLNLSQLKKQLAIDYNNYRSQLSQFDDTQDQYKDQKDNLTLTDQMKRILVRSQSSLDSSVANYELGDLAIKYATLTSPIEGIVTNVNQLATGLNISPATSSIYIIDPKSIYFKSQIDQADVPKLKMGDKTSVSLDSFPDKKFDSTVSYISFTPVAGQSSTVYEVRFAMPIDNSNMTYRLGMDGDATVDLGESQNALTIPSEALFEDTDSKYVYVKTDNNQLTKKIVKTGIETDTNIEILEGLSENDQVVIKQK